MCICAPPPPPSGGVERLKQMIPNRGWCAETKEPLIMCKRPPQQTIKRWQVSGLEFEPLSVVSGFRDLAASTDYHLSETSQVSGEPWSVFRAGGCWVRGLNARIYWVPFEVC